MLEPDRVAELASALREHAPGLRLVPLTDGLIARGAYELRSRGAVLDRYMVELAFDGESPSTPPRVWETSARIPRTRDFHVNPADGTCCLAVHDEWLATTGDASLAGFLQGPFRNFFLSQTHYRIHRNWPFEDRPHGLPGMVESYAELVDCPADAAAVGRLLSFLSIGHQKGHWQCPCGSGALLRKCCREKMQALATHIDAQLARRLMSHLQRQIEVEMAAKPRRSIIVGYNKH